MAHTRKFTINKIIALLVVVILLAISAIFVLKKWGLSSYPQSNVLRVDQVWANAEKLDGQVIHIRGKLEGITYQTLQLCDPPTCDCNQSGANYSLVSDSDTIYNQGCSSKDTIELPLECQGDECSLTCSPFDPFQAEALELVGTLRVVHQDGKLCRLLLDDIKPEESLQLVGGEWKPISVGAFTRALVTPSPLP